jgi:hypothetical protein
MEANFQNRQKMASRIITKLLLPIYPPPELKPQSTLREQLQAKPLRAIRHPMD